MTAITESCTGILGGVGSGAVAFFESIFLNAEKTGLSNFGTYLLFGTGLGIAIGIMRWIRKKLA